MSARPGLRWLAGGIGSLLLSTVMAQALPPLPPPPQPLAPSPTPTGLRENGPLAALGFLAGACWQAPLPGGAQSDSHCIRWFQQGRYLRARHEVQGSQPPFGGETTYYRDPQDGRLRSLAFDVRGGISRGTVRVLSGGAVQIDERHVGPEGRFLQRSRYAPVDANRVAARFERSDDDGRTWRVLNDARYSRQPINW